MFGPETYVRTKGKPNVFTGEFPGIPSPGALNITNGTVDGKNRISSATVYVNGEEVVSPNAFSQQVDFLSVPLEVLEENSIEIRLGSKPGAFLSVAVVEEIDAEAATVIGPSGGTLGVADPTSPFYGRLSIFRRIRLPRTLFSG